MLKMAQTNYIKYLREEEGCTISEIAKRLNINWRTANKYADEEISYQERPTRKRKSPVMGPYMEIVDAWLEEDLRMPRKQRRTAKAIYNQLKANTDFNGSRRSVRGYVRNARKEIKDAQNEQYIKLEHFPGEAQVDFGKMSAILKDTMELVTYPYLVMSFPYSNNFVCRVLPAENMECFLTALRWMIEEIDGTPRVIWFDNLKPAVKRILEGPKRECTPRFTEFMWHYRFKSNFCSVGKGNEKGHTESKVGYVRRNWMSPPPVINDLEGINSYLKVELEADRDREHYDKKEQITKLWEEDKKALLVLPRQALEITRTTSCVVNKYGEIKVDYDKYHVPQAHPGQRLFIKIYWDKLEILDAKAENIIYECSRKYLQKTENINWAEELKVFENRPRALELGTYVKALPQVLKEYLLVSDLSQRRKRIKALISLLEEYDISMVTDAVKVAIEAHNTDITSIKAFIEYKICQSKLQKPLKENWTPQQVLNWSPILDDYNKLYEGGTN